MIELAGALTVAGYGCYFLWSRNGRDVVWVSALVLCAAGLILALASLS